ncbi:thermonuclease family protein [Thioclava litoralis]|uniref:Thermonuclease family protein n=1 Tax=Thioclava litoralis TaxID=3076557 RepID=A0ABZ1DW72_9RHOB|nr:thermonuclease family protein [Thioclava sp. FTW29]
MPRDMWGMFRLWSVLILACLVLGVTAPAHAETLYGKARVVDGDTLDVAGRKIRIYGIDAPESKQTCLRDNGQSWPCGQDATAQMRKLATGRVACTGTQADRYGRLIARCEAHGVDLGAQMVAQGYALAYRQYSTAYVSQEKSAMIAKRGIWVGQVETPAHYRAHVNDPQGRCKIKGNISKNGHLYHVPGMASYAATKIDTAKGERWFCTEAEARSAGWVRAK